MSIGAVAVWYCSEKQFRQIRQRVAVRPSTRSGELVYLVAPQTEEIGLSVDRVS